MSWRVSQRMIGQPMNTGSQQVRIRYSSTDGTAIAVGTPNAARPPISAASTAPTPPGVGAAEARVPPTIVTTVTVTNDVCPPNASMLAHSANAMPRVVAAQPSTMMPRRLGSRASSARSLSTSLSRGRTAVANHRRSLGTKRNAPTEQYSGDQVQQSGRGDEVRQVRRGARGGAEQDQQCHVGDDLHGLLQCDGRSRT